MPCSSAPPYFKTTSGAASGISVMFDEINLSRIQDEQTRELIVRLLNLIEQQAKAIRNLQVKNQEL